MQQRFEWGAPAVASLKSWPGDLAGVAPSWRPLVQDFLDSPEGRKLSARLAQALAEGQVIYPPEPLRALTLTAAEDVRVLILGQDPYHGPGQAEGLAFSVAVGVKPPPSLRNIFKELQRSLNIPAPTDGSLVRWARQGVLLLNTCLTVQEGQAASHARWGWEALTDPLVQSIASRSQPVVFMLWGGHAQTKKGLIQAASAKGARHLILEANHPSPLSALRPPVPFLGCDHFRLANAFLAENGQKTIDW
jgi:uracil-DNA glycosylase